MMWLLFSGMVWFGIVMQSDGNQAMVKARIEVGKGVDEEREITICWKV